MNQPDDDKTQAVTVLSRGTVINHYRIIEKIGAGGMGEVYLAEDTSLNRKVALKFLSAHLCQDSDCRARFKREAQAAAKLGHSNIVAVHEVGEHQGRPFFAMELVEGRSLDEIVAAGRLDENTIVELAQGICNGLRKAHESGVVHRDIKPSNIIVDHDNVPRVLDFGLAAIRDSDKLTQAGTTLGTIGYMSPEQVAGRAVDTRSDLFSLGVVLYEMVAGLNPFRRDNQVATLKAISEDTPKPFEIYRSGISGELQRIVSKLLEKRPELRYQTAADLASDLRRLSGTAPATSQRSRKRLLVTVGSAAILIGALVIVYVLTRNQNPESTRKTLAVLPFQNLSPDPDQEYFSDGLTEELTSKLSLVQSLCVISRSSSMTFKGSNKTIPEIAKALKVQYIVEGSVRRAGNALRITAQLIDAANDAHLWSNTYTGTLDDVFGIQNSVTQSIAKGINSELTATDKLLISRSDFDNSLAYEYYLRGRDEILRKGSEAAIRRGLEYIQHGLSLSEDNPRLLVGMAEGYWSLVNSGIEQDSGIACAKGYLEKALTKDPELAEAHAMLGMIDGAFWGRPQEAVQRYKKALSFKPDCEIALRGLFVNYALYAGRPSVARPFMVAWQQLYPFDTLAKVGQPALMSYGAADFETALEGFRKLHQQGPKIPTDGEIEYAMTLAQCGYTQEAIAVADTCITANPSNSVVGILRLMRWSLLNDRAAALRELTPELRQTCLRDGYWSYDVGNLLVKCGATEEAYFWLENAVNRGWFNHPFMLKDPFLDSIRNEDRYKRLMERVKYEWEHFEV